MESITPHLLSMNSTIRVNRSLYGSLEHTEQKNIKVEILCDKLLESESTDDVIPKLQGYDALDTRSFKTEHRFHYRAPGETLTGMDAIEDQIFESLESYRSRKQGSAFTIFKKESLRSNCKSAFHNTEISVKKFIRFIRERDNITKNIIADWSEVDPEKIVKKSTLRNLSVMKYRIWRKGWMGFLQKLTWPVKGLVQSKGFTVFISLVVLANIVVLSLNRYGMSSELENTLTTMNTIFTIIFVIEMGLKIIALGIVDYGRDKMNYLDGIITLLSLIEIIFISDTRSAISAFRGIRIFRLIRVVRIIRLFRYLQSMAHIFSVISQSLSKFIYLAMFLLLLIVIYSLVGMKIFAGELNLAISRSTFDSFHWAFITVFQVLTLENWQNVLYSVMNSSVGSLSCLYLISWIFLGNYIVLNLFLAILLDAFSEESKANDFEEIENDEEDFSPFLRRRTSLYGNFEGRLMRRRLEQIKKIEVSHEQDSDQGEVLQMNSITRLDRLYQGISSEKSLNVFSKSNKFRIFCVRISTSPRFEGFIFAIIIISSIKLVVDTYIANDSLSISNYIDVSITFIFAGEFIIKSITYGMIFDKGSYLRDWWNSIDFFIVVVSIIDFALTSISIKYIKIFRLLRTLRPLRFISHNLSMKIVVKALLESIVAIINVVIVCMIVWLMFGILGVSLFGGKLYTCSNAQILNSGQCEEYGFSWDVKYPNYDNIISAMTTLFILSSLEGWPDIMYSAIDAKDVGVAPELNFSPYSAYYFISFIFIGSFFFLNLFIGVIFNKFNEAKESETHLTALVLSKDQANWVEIQRLIVRSKLKIDASGREVAGIRRLLHSFVKSSAFQYFILTCIVLNMIEMAMPYESASADYLLAIDYSNIAFSLIFILEAIIKVSAMGFEYFKNNWNRFDFFVALTSALDLIMSTFFTSSFLLLRLGPQLIRIIKVLKVSRLVRLLNFLKPLQNLLTIMVYSLPAIMNVLSLLTLLFFIYSVLGVYLFGDLKKSQTIDEYTNFTNFGNAMITLFRCSTGENWYAIMQDLYESHGIYLSSFYFMSFITISTFVMFNLFIMVILQNYDDYMSNPDSVFKNFNKDFKTIKLVWLNHCSEDYIEYKRLGAVMCDLGSSLGVAPGTDFEKLSRVLASINFDVDSDGNVHFKDFLFCLLRRKYGRRIKEENVRKIVMKEEQATRKKIRKQRDEKLEDREEGNNNYFMQMMNARIVFKSWKTYVKKRREKQDELFASVSVTPRDFEEDYPGNNSCNEILQHEKSGVIG